MNYMITKFEKPNNIARMQTNEFRQLPLSIKCKLEMDPLQSVCSASRHNVLTLKQCDFSELETNAPITKKKRQKNQMLALWQRWNDDFSKLGRVMLKR